MSGTGTSATQFEMSDEFYEFLVGYMRYKKITLEDLSRQVKIPIYLLSKIMDRKIKMCCYLSLLQKIANVTGAVYVTLGKTPTAITNK